MSLVNIIIPTYDNYSYIAQCVQSIIGHRFNPGLFRVTVINNGKKESVPEFINPDVTVIHSGSNLGWEGGLKKGLENTTEPFVVFMNDDTFIPMSSSGWIMRMLEHFSDPKVAAVGPSSNIVMGVQNIFVPTQNNYCFEVSFLIGFCMLVRRDYLEAVGGVDDNLPYHGDDIDLSIRFRKAGYKLICDKSAFVYHHGFKTGVREFGSEWNSVQMTEKTNNHLIKKHGLKTFWETITCPIISNDKPLDWSDKEGNVIRKYINENDSVLELGCGSNKTVSHAIGLDIVPKGELIPGLLDTRSVADVSADIKEKLPFEDGKFQIVIARHILEHLINPISVLKEWDRVIKPGGKLIIAVPNQEIRNTIPMNYQHLIAFTPESLRTLMETLGWHQEITEDPKNDISFVSIFSKNGVSNGL
jgi:O-antigen biosynthesis protein